jgi:hypothetical protein
MNFKKIVLRFWPIIFIFFIWLIFSSPYFFQNKVPFSSSYLVNFFSPWNAYPGFTSPVKNNAMPDVISQIYPWKNLTIDTFKNFQIPFWNPYSFSGTPHLANYQSAVFSPFNLIFFILPFIDAWRLLILFAPLLAGRFMFLLLKELKSSDIGALIGSVAFMFCGFITTWMAYGTLSYAILFLPISLFFVEKFYNTNKNRYLLLFSLTIPLSFFSGHFQISIYFFIFVFSYLIFKLISERKTKKALLTFVYLFIGFLFSLPQLLPSIELYFQTLRSGIFQKIEVIPWGYLPTFIAPDFFGNPVTRNDWFGHYAEWNAYIGVIPLLLAFYALISKRSKLVIYLGIVALTVIFISFQTPLLDLLVMLKIPVISTSAASRVIVIFSFVAAILASIGFDAIFNDIKNKKIKKISIILFSSGVVFIFLWIAIMFKLFLPLDKIIIAKQNLILPTIFYVSLVGLILSILFLEKSKYFKKYIFIIPIIILLIVSFDLLRFANKWMPFDKRELMYPNVKIVSEFNKISSSERVFGNLGGESTIYYKLPTVGGYDAVYIQRYGEFVKYIENGEFGQSYRSVVEFPKNGKYTEKAINLFGVKYIIHKIADGQMSWTFPYWKYKEGTFKSVYNDKTYEILENTKSFDRAFLVNSYIVEKDSKNILQKMFNTVSLRDEVVLEKNLNIKLDQATGSARILSYTPNKVTISTNSNGNNLLLLTDSFYTGWNAYIDGKKVDVLRADYTFRAVGVPKGSHEVVFSYESKSFLLGLVGVILGVILLIGVNIKNLFGFPKFKFT